MKKGRFSTTRPVAKRSGGDPTLGNQLFRDYRHSAPLQTRTTRKIRPGNRLMFTDKIQDDATIDAAGRFRGGHPEVGQIYRARGHGRGRFLTCEGMTSGHEVDYATSRTILNRWLHLGSHSHFF